MNILLIVVIAFVLIEVILGFKRGLVKSLTSLIALIMLSVLGILLINLVKGYFNQEMGKMLISLILLTILGILHLVVKLVLFPLKLLAKLPVIKLADKLLGVAFGIMAVAVVVWVVYGAVMLLGTDGRIAGFIMSNTLQNPILSWMYNHNVLLKIIASKL